jgi:hypothetical protein
MTLSATAADPFGDFQTPPELAAEVWAEIDAAGVELVIEPTVGLGAFLATAPDPQRQLPWIAYDIDPTYVARARLVAAARGIAARIECADAFGLDRTDLSAEVAGKVVLAIGNPPWVTNAAQAATGSRNLPDKLNRFGLRGLDAMTGKANFDIAEAILLSVLAALSSAAEVRLAFLIKRSVALKMAKDLLRTPGITAAAFSRIDAQKSFGASVEAGLFQFTFRPGAVGTTDRVALAEELNQPFTSEAGIVNGRFVGNVTRYQGARQVEAEEGAGLVWRQGIKHDVSKILELKPEGSGLTNGLGESVDIEDEVLCPLFKSSDVAAGRPARRTMPLYQHDLSGPLSDLAHRWPKLSSYLAAHRVRFAARGSSIYRGKPDFMLFGVGPYTLSPFKVAISGFYKAPRFTLLRADQLGRPPLVDDTCYMLPFTDEAEAVAMARYLNGALVQDFLLSIADITAKRPYTKDVLGRIAAPVSRRAGEQLSLAPPAFALAGRK